ncbi:SDR family oxidoreductase [Streptomyces sp. B6B3]|uniref:SDR family oxidoreductase n=1 Tax=Streptomyces sp. B6B3 TaxID=3153570 RepID=UPI00325C3FD5
MTNDPNSSRVALVTGANRGLGTEIARQLLTRGFHVWVTARHLPDAQATAGALGPHARPLQLDVSSPTSITTAIDHAIGALGRIDVLINNAGITDGLQPATGPDFALAAATLETNVLGAWRTATAVIPHMVAAGYGRIVNISSNLGSLHHMTDAAGEPAYRVSKAALNALTRLLAAELAGTGVLVNAASPGWTRTDMGGAHAPRDVEEGADTPVWLATLPETAHTTGQLFYDREPLTW